MGYSGLAMVSRRASLAQSPTTRLKLMHPKLMHLKLMYLKLMPLKATQLTAMQRHRQMPPVVLVTQRAPAMSAEGSNEWLFAQSVEPARV